MQAELISFLKLKKPKKSKMMLNQVNIQQHMKAKSVMKVIQKYELSLRINDITFEESFITKCFISIVIKLEYLIKPSAI